MVSPDLSNVSVASHLLYTVRRRCWRSLMNWTTGGSRGLMDRASELQPEVVGSNLGSSRNCCWGEWTTSVLSTFDTTIEVSVHLNGLNAEHKFQVWVTILGHTSLFINEWFLSNMFLITCLRSQNKEEITCSKSSMQALIAFSLPCNMLNE